ncbi:MAG: hypothetical protein KJO00_06505 [Bacteroidia bacterium]|nr:hypothetical protein [Bacteroidia bacterium]NNK72839.1 hypothetical protein [Flavobacteriaceae bacterium]
MKSNFYYLFFVFALLLASCNTDNLEESPDTLQLSERSADRPFKVRSAGSFNVVEPDVCAPLAQIILEGSGNGTHIGLFDVYITWCDDFAGTTIQNGIVTAANGDELYFYVTGFGIDDDGEFGEYTFEGGTGRFEDSYGFLKLYNLVEFTGPGVGTYSNQGEGFINY